MWFRPIQRWALIAVSTLAPLAIAPQIARAEFPIAYCDGEKFAVNIYRAGDPEDLGAALTMRIYDRAQRITFLTAPADRLPNPEGYNYTNQLGENQWELFISNSTELFCALSRDGQVMDSGTATRRELPSSDR